MKTQADAIAASAASLCLRLAWASGFAGTGAGGGPLSAEEVRTAVGEGLGPLLGYRLRNGAPIVERAEDRALLERQHLAGVAQELAQGHLLSEVGELLGRQELPFLRLKAAALRGLVLPEGARPAGDIDLLVPRARFVEAVELLRGNGFTLLGDGRRSLTVSRYHERNLQRYGLLVDLHRDLSAWPLFSVPSEDLMDEALPAPRGAGGGLVPESARLLVSLAVHATQHGFLVSFRSIIDALALVQVLRPDPLRVVETARRWHVVRGTSLLLGWLGRLGLEDVEWRRAALELAGRWPLERFVDRLPIAARADPVATLRRERWWRVRLVDDPWRTWAFYAYRGALWAGDVALRGTPGRWRARLEDVRKSDRSPARSAGELDPPRPDGSSRETS